MSIAFIRAALPLLAGLLFIAGCSKGDTPDRVVDVVLSCTRPSETRYESTDQPDGSSTARRVTTPAEELAPATCQRLLDGATENGKRTNFIAAYDVHQLITVRSQAGGSYEVRASVAKDIDVGDPWPPE